MKALQVRRSLPRFAAARLTSSMQAGGGRLGPLQLSEIDLPPLPAPDWVELRPLLSGICGSDLSTLNGASSRWFEPLVSFPFVPGHEVAAETPEGRRVVVEPVLSCRVRGVDPVCRRCAAGHPNHCERLTAGHIKPGLQTGYCQDTGGGWSHLLVAHPDQLHDVPEHWSDEAAVMVEPTACAVHGALSPDIAEGSTVVVIGAGTLGLLTVAALSARRAGIENLIVAAKYPEQRRLARELGATSVVEPDELCRAVRLRSESWMLDNGQLTGGADVVFDCVGSAGSLADTLAVAAPGGTACLIGMAGHVQVDLTPLWQREIRLVGAYAYGPEKREGGRHSFDLAMELIEDAGLARLVSATYPLERFTEALDHAGSAGRRGAVKVAFDMRHDKRR